MTFELNLNPAVFDTVDKPLVMARLVHIINEAALRLPPVDDSGKHVLCINTLDDRVEVTYDEQPLVVIDSAVLEDGAFLEDVFWTYQAGTGTPYVTTRDGAR